MDYYRHIHGPFPDCVSHNYLMQILAIGEPPVARSPLRIKDILHRQESLFFPKAEVWRVLENKEVLEQILRCRCEQCEKYLVMSKTESKEIAQSILSQDHPKVVLLAILIYLGRVFLIRYLAQGDSVHDAALTIDREILCADDFPDLSGKGKQANRAASRSSEDQEWFLEDYHLARMLFDPPAFRTKDKWTLSYPKDCRFPFVDDQKHGEGSFGEVYKFNIHPNYLDIDPECAKRDWYQNQTGVTISKSGDALLYKVLIYIRSQCLHAKSYEKRTQINWTGASRRLPSGQFRFRIIRISSSFFSSINGVRNTYLCSRSWKQIFIRSSITTGVPNDPPVVRMVHSNHTGFGGRWSILRMP